VATYVVFAALTAVFATDIVALFAETPDSPEIPIAVNFVYAACVAVVFQGISGGAAGPLDAAGDTKIPFASQFLGMFCVSIPLAYVGAREATPAIDVPGLAVTIPEVSLPAIGLWGVYLAFLAETTIPAAINYWRFHSGKWKKISEAYRPDAPADE